MKAVWYERGGSADDVLQVGTMNAPEPGVGEVRIRVAYSAVNPYDVKKRAHGRELADFGRIIPHTDGSGEIDRVGEGVLRKRIGERVWIFGGQVSQANGSCAEYCVVPAWKAVTLPDGVSLKDGACLGIPAVTAYQALFADGSLEGKTVLVAGGAGRVGAYAVQFASRSGAKAIASAAEKNAALVGELGADQFVDYADPDLQSTLREMAGKKGFDLIVESGFGRNIELNARILSRNGVISAYGFDDDPAPVIPAMQLLMKNAVCRFIGIFALSRSRQEAILARMNSFLVQHGLQHRVGLELPLRDAAQVHSKIESGGVSGAALIRI